MLTLRARLFIAAVSSLAPVDYAHAQSPFATRTDACGQACDNDKPPGLKGPSPINPFFQAGGTIGFTAYNKGDFPFSPFAVGKLQLNTLDGNSHLAPHLAFISNIEAPDLKSLKSPDDVKDKLSKILNGNDGVSLLASPYWTFRDNPSRLKLHERWNGVLWFSGGLKFAAAKDSADTAKKWIQNRRFSGGLEGHWYRAYDDSLPLTFSVEPAVAIGGKADYAHFFRTTETRHELVELNAIVPLSSALHIKLGILHALNTIMLDWSFGKGVGPSYRAAILTLK